jgi:hypothetical protein
MEPIHIHRHIHMQPGAGECAGRVELCKVTDVLGTKIYAFIKPVVKLYMRCQARKIVTEIFLGAPLGVAAGSFTL